MFSAALMYVCLRIISRIISLCFCPVFCQDNLTVFVLWTSGSR